jgi:hypothetical protein
MGASGWEYVVPYQNDLGTALDVLRHEVFASGDWLKPDYYGDVFDLPEPSSVDDLTRDQRYWEFMGTSGTHSIIDIQTVVPADFAGDAEEEFCTIRPLLDKEYVALFGVAQPTRAGFDALDSSAKHDYVTGGRWTGRAAVLWDAGVPAEIAFWGYSGD